MSARGNGKKKAPGRTGRGGVHAGKGAVPRGAAKAPARSSSRRAADPLARSGPLSLAVAMEEYLEILESRGYAAATLKLRRWMLREFVSHAATLGVKKVHQVTGDHLREFMVHISQRPTSQGKERYARGVVEIFAVSLRVFFRHLAKRGVLLFDPSRDLEKIKSERQPARALSPAQMERVLSRPDPSRPEGIRDRAILELLYSTGIRRAELGSLRVEDVRTESGTLLVRQGKGRKDRVVPVGERALSFLSIYTNDVRPALRGHAKSDEDSRILFLTRHGKKIHPETLTGIVSNYLRACGIEKGACHIFRHTCATEMLSGGADIAHIQELLGHERTETSRLYTHVSPERLREKYARSHPAVFGVPASSGDFSPTPASVRRFRTRSRPEGFGNPKREFPVRMELERRILEYLNFRTPELSERTLEAFRFYLFNFSGWCFENSVKKISRLTTPLLERYQKHLSRRKKRNGETISLKTQRYEMEAVCAFVRWCSGRGLLLYDPSAAIELPRVGRSLVNEVLSRTRPAPTAFVIVRCSRFSMQRGFAPGSSAHFASVMRTLNGTLCGSVPSSMG
jgi:integrase/recombinase XerD